MHIDRPEDNLVRWSCREKKHPALIERSEALNSPKKRKNRTHCVLQRIILRRLAVVLVIAAGCVMSAAEAFASNGSILDHLLKVEVRSTDKSSSDAEFLVPIVARSLTPGGTLNWDLPEKQTLVDGSGNELATLENASIFIDLDPVLAVDFTMTNGTNFPLMVTITSGTIMFDDIVNGIARASASMGITDTNGDGATVSGGFQGNSKSYIANFNGTAPGGVNFATLVSNLTENQPFGSESTSQEFPANGSFANIPFAVNMMSAQFDFILGPGDSIGATSVFVVIIPEPTTFALFGLASAALLLHRRKRNQK